MCGGSKDTSWGIALSYQVDPRDQIKLIKLDDKSFYPLSHRTGVGMGRGSYWWEKRLCVLCPHPLMPSHELAARTQTPSIEKGQSGEPEG